MFPPELIRYFVSELRDGHTCRRRAVTRAARRASPTGRDLIRLKLENWTSKDGQARSGLKVAAWKVERLGEIGRRKRCHFLP